MDDTQTPTGPTPPRTKRKTSISLLAVLAAVALLVAGFVVGNLVRGGTSNNFKNTAATYPSPSTTGVPAGAVLTAYTGPSNITTCGTVIDHKIITGGLTIRATNGKEGNFAGEAAARAAACVTITNSRFMVSGGTDQAINSRWTTDTTCKVGTVAHPCGPIFVADSEVNETAAPTGIINLMVETNFHLWRVYIHGGDQAVNCDGYCDIHDSYLEASRLDTTGNAHMDAFSSNGNAGFPVVLDHNTLFCHVTNQSSVPSGSGGCSGDVGFFGDFGSVSNVTVTNNLFMASGDPAYCVYTGGSQPGKVYKTGANLAWSNNVWERGSNSKCATYGPVADWSSSASNVWCGNRWATGEFVIPSAETCAAGSPSPTHRRDNDHGPGNHDRCPDHRCAGHGCADDGSAGHGCADD